jgi:hypothetical protein
MCFERWKKMGKEIDKYLLHIRRAALLGVNQLATKCADEKLDEEELDVIASEISSALNYAKWVNSVAYANRKLIQENKTRNIISLGRDCLGRTLPSKLGLIFNKKQGRQRLPFDLATHPIEAVLHLLRTDFKDYFEADEYSFDARGLPTIKKHNIVFNHEDMTKIQEDNFEYLVQANTKRVEDFLSNVAQGPPLFLFHAAKWEVTHCVELSEYLLEKFIDSRICIVMEITPDAQEMAKRFEGKVELISKTYRQGYRWHRPKCYIGTPGRQIEHEIEEGLSTAMCLS